MAPPADRPRFGLAALVAIVALLAALASDSPAQGPGSGISVKIGSTGNDSELRRTVPIARHPGGGSRVAMSMTPRDLPNLAAGDVLVASAEVQVTTDCLNREPPRQCKGSSYRFNPVVGAQLVLAGNPDAVTGPGTLALGGRRRITCRQKPPSRERHCMIVFTAAETPIADPASLPCAPECHVNLVLDSHHPDSRANDRLIVGSTGPTGRSSRTRGASTRSAPAAPIPPSCRRHSRPARSRPPRTRA